MYLLNNLKLALGVIFFTLFSVMISCDSDDDFGDSCSCSQADAFSPNSNYFAGSVVFLNDKCYLALQDGAQSVDPESSNAEDFWSEC